jgi:hypothetical protein
VRAGKSHLINGLISVFDPFLVFLTAFLKPLLASVFAIVIFSIFKSGLITLPGISLIDSDEKTRYIIWIMGFLSGFSERFAGDIIARAEASFAPGKPGGTNSDS